MSIDDPLPPRRDRDTWPPPTQPYTAPLPPAGITPVPDGWVVTPLTTPTSGYATASLVLGLGTFVSLGATGVLAVIFGHLAVRETKTGQRAGHGMAITGLILGYLAVAGWAVFIALLLAGTFAAGTGAGR